MKFSIRYYHYWENFVDGMSLELVARRKHIEFAFLQAFIHTFICKYSLSSYYVPGSHVECVLSNGHWLRIRVHTGWDTSVSFFNPPQILLRKKLKPLQSRKANEIKSFIQSHWLVKDKQQNYG